MVWSLQSRRVAERLRDTVRSLDFISRIGGDEFVILLPDISPDAAAKKAERIIANIATPPFFL